MSKDRFDIFCLSEPGNRQYAVYRKSDDTLICACKEYEYANLITKLLDKHEENT